MEKTFNRGIINLGFVTILIISFAAVSSAQTAEQLKQASKLFGQAIKDHNSGQFDQAIYKYTKYLRIRPNVAAAWYNRGLAYYQKGSDWRSGSTEIVKGNIDKAVLNFSQAIRLDPKSEDSFTYRGLSYAVIFVLDVKRYSTLAISDFSSAIELNPNSSENYRRRGDMHEAVNRYDEAFSDYNKAINLNRNNTAAYLGRGKVYNSKKDFRLAKSDIENALRLDPGNDSAKSLLEWVAENLAKAPMKKTAPETWKTYSDRGRVFLEQKDAANAVASFEKAIGMLPRQTGNNLPALLARLDKSRLLEYMAKSYFLKNDFDRAIEYYIEAQSDLLRLFGESYRNDIRSTDITEVHISITDSYIRHATTIADFGRRGLDLFQGVTLSSGQKLQLLKLGILKAGSANLPAKLLHANSTLWLRRAQACKTDKLSGCGERSSKNQIIPFASRALAEINKGIGFSPSMKILYLQRAEVYRFLGKDYLALADKMKANQLKDK